MKDLVRNIVCCALAIILVSGCSGADPAEPADQMSAQIASQPPSMADVAADCAGDFDISETEATPAQFEIDGTRAIMRGVIDSNIADQIETLLDKHPEVRTLVIAYSPGSDDDDANLEAGLMVNEAQLATCVPEGGEISSGAVDLFLAGSVRVIGEDAWVGVHSWSDEDGIEGRNLPADDPEHEPYLDYFEQIGVDEDFYWFTLDVASADGMHNMTDVERQEYELETP